MQGCCLMAPWIMEKDDFKYTMSFGDDLFGGTYPPRPRPLFVAPDARPEPVLANHSETIGVFQSQND
eukprot:COSAG06_NODE_2813_length_6243_cov_7.236165_5_plen_67_part_00